MSRLNVIILSLGVTSKRLTKSIDDLSMEVFPGFREGIERSMSPRLFDQESQLNSPSLCCVFADEVLSPLQWKENVESHKQAGALVLLFLISNDMDSGKSGEVAPVPVDHECACFKYDASDFPTIAEGLRALVDTERKRDPMNGAFDWSFVKDIFGHRGRGQIISLPLQSPTDHFDHFLLKKHELLIISDTVIGAYMLVDNEFFASKSFLKISRAVHESCNEGSTVATSIANLQKPMIIFFITPIEINDFSDVIKT